MIAFQLVKKSDLEELLTLGKKTFCDAFQHLNNAEDFDAYFAIAFTPEKLLSEIENSHSEFYFAMLCNEKVGYIKLNYKAAQSEFKDEDAVEVERIYIMADQQGKQIGKQLLNFAIKKAVDAQLRYIWLGVWEHNQSAIRFYEREGFKRFSTHKFALGKDIQTDVLMRKELR